MQDLFETSESGWVHGGFYRNVDLAVRDYFLSAEI